MRNGLATMPPRVPLFPLHPCWSFSIVAVLWTGRPAAAAGNCGCPAGLVACIQGQLEECRTWIETWAEWWGQQTATCTACLCGVLPPTPQCWTLPLFLFKSAPAELRIIQSGIQSDCPAWIAHRVTLDVTLLLSPAPFTPSCRPTTCVWIYSKAHNSKAV